MFICSRISEKKKLREREKERENRAVYIPNAVVRSIVLASVVLLPLNTDPIT